MTGGGGSSRRSGDELLLTFYRAPRPSTLTNGAQRVIHALRTTSRATARVLDRLDALPVCCRLEQQSSTSARRQCHGAFLGLSTRRALQEGCWERAVQVGRLWSRLEVGRGQEVGKVFRMGAPESLFGAFV